MDNRILLKYKNEVLAEVRDNILEFWMKNVIDYDSGGFNGSVAGDGTINAGADKGLLMATRILWTFSRAYMELKDPRYLKTSDLMFNYISNYFIDKEHGGAFWLLDCRGKPKDRMKKLYGQGFTVFALAEYAKASLNGRALNMANDLFALCEKYGRDREFGGYIDALGHDWSKTGDTRLSAREMNAPKSMNTNLHVMEAYSALAGYYRDKKVTEALESLVNVFNKKIYRPSRHLAMFFDMKWKKQSDLISYGHDIETSWLMTEAAEVTGNRQLMHDTTVRSIAIAQISLKQAIDKDGGLFCEGDSKGPHKMFKEWWMQAEAMVGYMNAYQLTGKEIFLEQSVSFWEYCKKKLIRPEGGWYFYATKDGAPDTAHEIAGQWKCPYHTGRTCFEIRKRIEKTLTKS